MRRMIDMTVAVEFQKIQKQKGALLGLLIELESSMNPLNDSDAVTRGFVFGSPMLPETLGTASFYLAHFTQLCAQRLAKQLEFSCSSTHYISKANSRPYGRVVSHPRQSQPRHLRL